jgi:hypothetical protein
MSSSCSSSGWVVPSDTRAMLAPAPKSGSASRSHDEFVATPEVAASRERARAKPVRSYGVGGRCGLPHALQSSESAPTSVWSRRAAPTLNESFTDPGAAADTRSMPSRPRAMHPVEACQYGE